MRTNIERILRAFQSTVWAIQREKLDALVGLLELRARGQAIDPESTGVVEAGRPEAASRRDRTVRPKGGDIAVIPLFGTIAQRLSGMDAMSGGASIERFTAAFDRAVNDDAIGGIVLQVDSPGGSVYGVEEASQKIHDARGTKRIVAVADSLMASAAYYIGSAADELVITPSGEAGSIGVFGVHFDFSRFLANEGIKPTIIKAGEHKAEGNQFEPLGDEALEHMQEQVNDYYDLFVDAVARNRGVSREAVLTGFGQGRTFTAQRAVEAGLADRVAPFEAVLDEVAEDVPSKGTRSASIVAPGTTVTATGDSADRRSDAGAGETARADDPTDTDPDGPTEGAAPPDATDLAPTPQAAPVAKEDAMAGETETQHDAARNGAANDTAVATAVEEERTRAAEIFRLAREHDIEEETAEAWVAEGISPDQASTRILSEQRARRESAPHVRVGADREAERPFANLGEQLLAIREAAGPGSRTDKRLLDINQRYAAATGSSTGVPSDGGFVIQPDFTRGIVSKMWNEGRILPRTNRVPIGENSNALVRNRLKENSRKDGSRYGGVRVYRVEEANTVEGSRPKLERQRIDLEKLMGIYYATEEVLQDAMALTTEAERNFRKELTFVAEDEVFRGHGAGQALGFLKSPALVVVPKDSGQAAGTITIGNIGNMLARLPASSFATAVWYINATCIPQLIQLKIGDTPVFIPGGNVAGAMFGTLMGLPIEPVEYCEALGTEGDIILADLDQYTTIDKAGVRWQESIHVRFLHDETAFKLTYRFNGQPDWPEAVEPYKGTDKISPFITLAERA